MMGIPGNSSFALDVGAPVAHRNSALTSAACELYLSLIAVNLSTEYLLRKLFRVSFPPSCIFLSWSGDQASMVTDLQAWQTLP